MYIHYTKEENVLNFILLKISLPPQLNSKYTQEVNENILIM